MAEVGLKARIRTGKPTLSSSHLLSEQKTPEICKHCCRAAPVIPGNTQQQTALQAQCYGLHFTIPRRNVLTLGNDVLTLKNPNKI